MQLTYNSICKSTSSPEDQIVGCITQTHRQELLFSAMHAQQLYDICVHKEHYTLSRRMSKLGEITVMGSSPQLVCLCQHPWLPFLLQRCHCRSCNCTGVSSSSSTPSFVQSKNVAPAKCLSSLGDSSIMTLAKRAHLSAAGKHHAVEC